MKPAQIAVVVFALGAGSLAALMMASQQQPPSQPVAAAAQPAKEVEMVEILVAVGDLPLGRALASSDMQWVNWPVTVSTERFIKKKEHPDAVEKFAGAVTRAPFAAGEPIREQKLIKGDGRGFMAALLPQGMRAVSIEISPESASGGFILPGDRVDVILTRRDPELEKQGVDPWTSSTILNSIRVLAIDQTFEERAGERVAVGRTATLELSAAEAEALPKARSIGSLSLALRSLADSTVKSEKDAPKLSNATKRDGVTVIRYGVPITVTPK